MEEKRRGGERERGTTTHRDKDEGDRGEKEEKKERQAKSRRAMLAYGFARCSGLFPDRRGASPVARCGVRLSPPGTAKRLPQKPAAQVRRYRPSPRGKTPG